MQSLDRVFDILEAFGHSGSKLGVTELGNLTGLHKSTVYRFLSALEVRGYVVREVETGKYSLGYRILELSKHVLDKLEIRQQAKLHLENLVQQCGETVYLVALESGETVYIDRVEGTKNLRLRSNIGSRGYAHSSASGKILLSEMPSRDLQKIVEEKGLIALTNSTITDFDDLVQALLTVREQGFAFDDIENEEDVRCIAAPIRDFRGKIIAAVSISGPSTRMTLERLKNELRNMIVDTANQISINMGYHKAEIKGKRFNNHYFD